MRFKVVIICLLNGFILLACQPIKLMTNASGNDSFSSTYPVASSTPQKAISSFPTQTTTFVIPLLTPEITATPIAAITSKENDIKSIEQQIFPYPCIGMNLVLLPETNMVHASKFNFVEVNIQPDPSKYIVEEIADNLHGTRQAWVACGDPNNCLDKLYVRDNQTKIVYEINWEDSLPWRPIEGVTWINDNILTFLQSANPQYASIYVVDFEEQKLVYEAAIFPDEACVTSTPTPQK